MAACDDNDDVIMLRRSSVQGSAIKEACSNTELVVMLTFDGCVYTCDPKNVDEPGNYVKAVFPTSEEDGQPDVDIVKVCSGRYHFLALSHNGHVYSWGKNTLGQLGVPKKKVNHKKQKQLSEDLKPRLIKGLSDYDVIQIACGDDHSLALTRDGRLFSWGSNSHGQLGIETEGLRKRAKHHTEKPIEIDDLVGVPLKHIAAGGAHSVALSTSGSVFVWGRNEHGQLGLQGAEDVKQPVKLNSMSQSNVKDISCGSHHTSFLKKNGRLLVYGMGVDRVPCESDEWSKSELSPGEPDRFQTFSFVQSTSRCTYAVEEFTGGIFVVKHDLVQSGITKPVSLGEDSIISLFEPVLQTDWPPGHYAFDPEVWRPSRPVEVFQPLSEETRRDDVAEADVFERIEEQEGVTTDRSSDDIVDGITDADFIVEHNGADDGFHDCAECRDDGDDASSDNDSFVTCDEDCVTAVPDDPQVDLEVRDVHDDERDALSTNPVDPDETTPKCTSPLSENPQHTSPKEQKPSSNESLKRRNTSCLDIEGEPTDMDTMAVGLDLPCSKINHLQLCANPTAATNIAGSMALDIADTTLCTLALEESPFHVHNTVSVEDGIADLSSAVDAASITGGTHCPDGETAVDELSPVALQANNQTPPRTWRRMCSGLEDVFIIEHDEPEGEEVHFSVASRREIDSISVELLQSLSDMKGTFTEDSRFQLARVVFSSPACINASFQHTEPNEVNGLNVDLKAARLAFELIGKNSKLLEELSKVIRDDLCARVPQLTPHDEALRWFLILMECPVFSNPQHAWGRRVLAAVAKMMEFLCSTSPTEQMSANAATLARWWKYEPMSFRRVIGAYRVALAFLVNDRTVLEREQEHFWRYLEVLRSLNEINLQNDILSIKSFYIPKLDEAEYQPRFYQPRHPLSLQKFCWTSYPFLLDLEFKTNLLEDQNMKYQEAAELTLFSNIPCFFADLNCLHLSVNRDDIFGEDIRAQLVMNLMLEKAFLRLRLKVSFNGEAGIDEGALRKDFFRLIFEELLDPQRNNFLRYVNELDPTHSSVWFRKECDDTELAKICGFLLGLSIHNQAVVPLPFPQLLYAKLLGKGPKTEIEEVAQLDKEFADQMSKLLNGTEEYVMGSCYGEQIELEDGRSVEVTKENVHLYVEKRVQEYLVPSQFKAFQEGFERVCDLAVLGMFRPIEFEALILGEKYFDWEALEQSTCYLGPYSDSHSTIRIFWKVFHALDDDMKRKFLVFVSGSDRVPIGGLRNLGLHIDHLPVPFDSFHESESCSPEETLRRLLPQGHACDDNGYRRTLRLPMYDNSELMEDRLLVTLSFYDCPFHIA